jgi:hypothetical protein
MIRFGVNFIVQTINFNYTYRVLSPKNNVDPRNLSLHRSGLLHNLEIFPCVTGSFSTTQKSFPASQRASPQLGNFSLHHRELLHNSEILPCITAGFFTTWKSFPASQGASPQLGNPSLHHRELLYNLGEAQT